MPACFWFCFASPFASISTSILLHLLIISSFTSSEQARPPHPQWPPIKLAQSPTLLFGSSNLSSPSPHCFLSYPVNGLWSGNTACFSDTNLSWDHILTFTKSNNDVGEASLLHLFGPISLIIMYTLFVFIISFQY